MTHEEWLDWQRKDIAVFYRGINITNRIGLCVCKDCIQHVKDDIDKELANNCA